MLRTFRVAVRPPELYNFALPSGGSLRAKAPWEPTMKSTLTLIGLDIECAWNVPVLANAAAMSGAALLFAQTASGGCQPTVDASSVAAIDEVWDRFDHVLACESVARSREVYDYPAPRGQVGVIVGNEQCGIPKQVLERADQVVSIPMVGAGMTSVNVAVAAAILLYAVQRDLGRRRIKVSSLSSREVDVLLIGPADPSELGSLLRSVWAFGWKRVFVADGHGIWFTDDRPTVLAGRAAARREVNPLTIRPADELDFDQYDQLVLCTGEPRGTPLSRFSLPGPGRLLLVYGQAEPSLPTTVPVERVFVDQAAGDVEPCYRHAGSILLSVVSQMLRRGRSG